jgi:PAS domain-containing protein
MIWVTDSTGYCHYLSQSWYEFTGQTPENGLGFGWLNAAHADDFETTENIFLAANNGANRFALNTVCAALMALTRGRLIRHSRVSAKTAIFRLHRFGD